VIAQAPLTPSDKIVSYKFPTIDQWGPMYLKTQQYSLSSTSLTGSVASSDDSIQLLYLRQTQ